MRVLKIYKTLWLLLIAILLINGCTISNSPQQFTDFALGTIISITTYGNLSRTDTNVINDLFQYAHDVEMRMSTTVSDYTETEILNLNNNAGIQPVSLMPDTFRIIKDGIAYTRLTNGAFNIVIWPLSSVWDIKQLEQNNAIPSAHAIQTAQSRINVSDVIVDDARSTIFLTETGMGVDVGGIAKGWVADHIATMLSEAAVTPAIIDIGGNIRALGTKPNGERWKIGIQDPYSSHGETVGFVAVGDISIVTSGDYERFTEINGVHYHHIIDPVTGYPTANNLKSVTIITKDGTLADALSTAVYIMGLEVGYQFVRAQPHVEALFLTQDREIIVTPALKDMFHLTNDAFTVVEYQPRSQ